MPISFNNNGNTCWFNSALQVVLNMDSINKIILLRIGKNKLTPGGFKLINLKNLTGDFMLAYVQILRHYTISNDDTKTEKVSCINPQNLHVIFSTYYKKNKLEQQDVSEAVYEILELLNNSLSIITNMARVNSTYRNIKYEMTHALEKNAFDNWKRDILTEYSVIKEIYYGQYRTCIICKNCLSERNMFEIFTIMNLPIPTTDNNTLTFYDCFKEFNKIENIEDLECDKCKIKTLHTKSISVWKWPKILIISLNRFILLTKNNTCIEIFDNKIVFSDLFTKKKVNYELKSVVNHCGSMLNSGHYFCIKNIKDKWYYCDDIIIKEIQVDKNVFQNMYLLVFEITK